MATWRIKEAAWRMQHEAPKHGFSVRAEFGGDGRFGASGGQLDDSTSIVFVFRSPGICTFPPTLGWGTPLPL